MLASSFSISHLFIFFWGCKSSESVKNYFFTSATLFSQFLSWPLDRFLFFFLHFASFLYVAFYLLPLSHWGKKLFQSCLFSLPSIPLLPHLTERGGKGEVLECSLHFCPTSLRGLPFQTNKQTHRHLQTKDKKWEMWMKLIFNGCAVKISVEWSVSLWTLGISLS